MREKYQSKIKETALAVTENKVSSIRKKEIVKTGCRVYDGKYMGVSGTLGEAAQDTWKAAEDNLKLEIEYPFEPVKGIVKTVDLREHDTTDEELMNTAEEILEYLVKEHPEFSYSGKISMCECEYRLTNELGTELVSRDKSMSAYVDVKELASVNIMDTVIGLESRNFSKERFYELADDMLKAYLNKVEMPKEEMYVVITPSTMLRKLNQDLNGEALGRKTSLLADRMGRQVFSEKLTVYKDSTGEVYMNQPFFDTEGTFNEDSRLPLIEKGIPVSPYTDKKTAKEFGMPLTGNAAGAYDDVPMIGDCLLNIKSSGKTLKELLAGRPGLVVVLSSGGDFTSAGDYAAPVQLAMLTDGERLIGRLPECSISGNIFDLLGKDYIGLSEDKLLYDEKSLVVRMKIGGKSQS
jgi:PmbA protein